MQIDLIKNYGELLLSNPRWSRPALPIIRLSARIAMPSLVDRASVITGMMVGTAPLRCLRPQAWLSPL
ncbi:MAG: hypothetical protein ACKO0Z_09015 [Betaproteobacteria bacterium]